MKLLRKEFRLALHPTNLIFLFFSAMLLIPSFPYYVTFFYTTLGIFFVCLNGREMHDMEYSMTLPLRKCDIVRGRILFAAVLELLQLVLAIPFAALRQGMMLPGNQVGMDSNIPFFGLAMVMMAVFNLVFFPRYYRNPNKIGSAFLLGSVAEFVYMLLMEALTHIVPFFRDVLDTPDTLYVAPKLVVLAVCMLLAVGMTYAAYRVSVKRFELVDL